MLVTFSPVDGGTLTVCDNGAAVGRNVAIHLFEAPVPSLSGLGIGLLQAAKQAARYGFRLALAANDPGRVCFVLAREGNELLKTAGRDTAKH